jgi:hypothetical protein
MKARVNSGCGMGEDGVTGHLNSLYSGVGLGSVGQKEEAPD